MTASEATALAVFFYLLVTAVWAGTSAASLRTVTARDERRRGARGVLSAPVWPLVILYWLVAGLISGLAWLIREAR